MLIDATNHPAYVVTSTGRNHTCGLDASGNAACFGRNKEGELGNGTLTDAFTVAVAVDTIETFQELSAGDEVTCGVTSGALGLCWGRGDMVGDGNVTRNRSPKLLSGEPPVGDDSHWGSAQLRNHALR